MTPRERFHLWANYQTKDIPAWGDWVGPYQFWVPQGLPPMPEGQTDAQEYQREYFNHEGIYSAYWGTSRLPVDLGMVPGYTPEVLWEDDTHVIARAPNGVVGKKLKNPKKTRKKRVKFLQNKNFSRFYILYFSVNILGTLSDIVLIIS